MLGPCLRRAYLPALPSRGRCRFLLCHFPVTEPHFSHGTSLRKRCLSLSRFCSSVVVKDNPCPIRWSHVGVSPHSVVIATFGRGVWSTTVSPFGCNFWNWIIPPPPLSTFRIPTFGHCSVKVLRSLLPALHATFLFYLFAPHLFLKYKAYVTTPEGGLLSNWLCGPAQRSFLWKEVEFSSICYASEKGYTYFISYHSKSCLLGDQWHFVVC